jgi:trimeric autotransporter adhesin
MQPGAQACALAGAVLLVLALRALAARALDASQKLEPNPPPPPPPPEPEPEPAPPSAVSVTLSAEHLPQGFSCAATVHAVFADGIPVLVSNPTLQSSDASVATVDGTTVQGIAPGVVDVRATVGGTLGSVTLVVTDAVLLSISLSPLNPAVARGSELQMVATATFSDGSGLDVTDEATWSSSHEAVATVDSSGLVTGVAGGSALLSARIGPTVGTCTLFVGA